MGNKGLEMKRLKDVSLWDIALWRVLLALLKLRLPGFIQWLIIAGIAGGVFGVGGALFVAGFYVALGIAASFEKQAVRKRR